MSGALRLHGEEVVYEGTRAGGEYDCACERDHEPEPHVVLGGQEVYPDDPVQIRLDDARDREEGADAVRRRPRRRRRGFGRGLDGRRLKIGDRIRISFTS